jgi:beta-N-acetylhexosaminidase
MAHLPALQTRRRNGAILTLVVGLVLGGCQPGSGPAVEVASEEAPGPAFGDILEPHVAEEGDSGLSSLEEEITARINSLTLAEKIAGLFVVFHPGVSLDEFQQFHDRVPVAGFLLLRSNLPGQIDDDAAFIGQLGQLGQPALILAVDQEGAPITRIRPDDLPGHAELGQGDPRVTRDVFGQRNDLVARLGANVNFGIVADVSSGPDSYIDTRSFGRDYATVASHVYQAVLGRAPGVAQTLKHFPGHGMTEEDSHVVVPRVGMSFEQWEMTHSRPFRAGVLAGVDMVMLSHVVVTSVSDDPATLSPFWVDVLRDEWGFEGVIVTDDLAMLTASGEEEFADSTQNVVRSLNAGVDLIVHTDFGPPGQELSRYDSLIAEVLEAVERGEIDEATVDRALRRVLALRLSLGDFSGGLENAHAGELSG